MVTLLNRIDSRVGPTVDPHVGRENGLLDPSARHDSALRDQAVERETGSRMFLLHVGEDKLGRRKRSVIRSDRPRRIVQIERRLHGDQVHVRLEVRLQSADVAPNTELDSYRGRGTETLARDASGRQAE